MVHDVRAESYETQLLGAVHDVARILLLGHLGREVHVHIHSLLLVIALHHGHRRLRLVHLAVALVHLQFIVEVDLHGLALRVVSIVVEMSLLVALRRYRPSLKVRLLFVQLLHIVRVG